MKTQHATRAIGFLAALLAATLLGCSLGAGMDGGPASPAAPPAQAPAYTLAASPAQGQTYYVDPNGSDQNDGSADFPWQTLQHAVDSVSPGDTILVRSGTYVGCRIEHSGNAGGWITLRAAPGASVLINAPGPNNAHQSNIEIETWEGDGTVSYWVIEGFEVANAPHWGIDTRGNETSHSHHIVIRGNTVHHSGLVDGMTGIFFAFTDDVLVEWNESYSNGEHGIYLSNSGDRFVVRHNLLDYNAGCGLHINGDLSQGGDGIISDGIVEANFIYENGSTGGSAINMDGVTNTIVRNNVLYENHAGGIALFQENGAVCSQNNRVLNNTIMMASDGRWAINLADTACTDNKIWNNVIYSYHSSRGSITIPAPEISGLESDYNAVMDRFSTDDGNSVITLAGWQALGYDQHSLIAEPAVLFVNPSTNDFHLLASSPARDAGMTLADVTMDVEGYPRPAGAAFDIGAYEYHETATYTVYLPLVFGDWAAAPPATPIASPTATSPIAPTAMASPTPSTTPLSTPGVPGGSVTYTWNDRVYRLAAQSGAAPEDVSQALDALSPGTTDLYLNASPDGSWLVLTTDRFDAECAGWSCLALVSGDLSSGQVISAGGSLLHPDSLSAVASTGDLIVYPMDGGPHALDLWAVNRSGGVWTAPVLLTSASPYAWNSQPAIAADGSTVVFDCGDQPYGAVGTAICEVGTAGSGFRVVLTPADSPPGFPTTGALHSPDYAPDGSIVFESDWAGEQIWRLPAGGGDPVRVAAQFGNDNSPCVLPDGRIVSLWLERPGGPSYHEIKVMAADGSTYEMLLINVDVADVGLGCSE